MIRSKAPFYSIGFVSIVLILSQSGQCGGSKMKASSNNSNQKVNPTQPKREQLTGNWGGQGIVMEIATSGTTLTFDCAHGAITAPPSTNSVAPLIPSAPGPQRNSTAPATSSTGS